MRGLTAFCRIRSYIATVKAHGIGVFTALRDAFRCWVMTHTPAQE
jgi:hypothetical protein